MLIDYDTHKPMKPKHIHTEQTLEKFCVCVVVLVVILLIVGLTISCKIV